MFDKIICRELEGLEGRAFEDYPELPAGEFWEQSDEVKLCKNPLVSVHMITYNHEEWIQEAIESVVNQVCDFEYELVIMEDCSTDSTRQICFDLQKKYPEKIRVLYGTQNERGRRNNARFFAKARGKWVAYLEGDDYWTDTHKLQKQINLLDETGAKGCFALVENSVNGVIYDSEWNVKSWTSNRMLTRKDVFKHYCHTSTYVFEKAALLVLLETIPCPRWYDTVLINLFSMRYPIALLAERVSVRRYTGKGIATSLSISGMTFMNIRQYRTLYKCGDRKLRWYLLTRLANECCQALVAPDEEMQGDVLIVKRNRRRLYTIALLLFFKKYLFLAPFKFAKRMKYCRRMLAESFNMEES